MVLEKERNYHIHGFLSVPISIVKVSVNGVEVRAVKPGVYRHTITGFLSFYSFLYFCNIITGSYLSILFLLCR